MALLERKGGFLFSERWLRQNGMLAFFRRNIHNWAPACWTQHPRFLFLRHRVKKQRKEPVQLELFIPHDEGYEFKVIVTNKCGKAKSIPLFHNYVRK